MLGMPFSVGDRITKVMPAPVMGKDVPLSKIFEPSDARYSEGAEFRALVESDVDVRRVVDMAKGLEGLKRQWGVHAAGVIMSSEPVAEPDPDHETGAGRRNHHPVRLSDLRDAGSDQDGLPRPAQP